MPEVFTYAFMQRAFLVGNMIALIAPLIGVFLIMKGLSQIGHTISHVALAGVALGILTGIYPVYPAILISVLAALGIEKNPGKNQRLCRAFPFYHPGSRYGDGYYFNQPFR